MLPKNNFDSRRKVQNLRIKFTKLRLWSDTSRARHDAHNDALYKAV